MANFNCFPGFMRKKNKGNRRNFRSGESKPTQRKLQIRFEEPVKPLENDNNSGHVSAIIAAQDANANASVNQEFSDFCFKASNFELVDDVAHHDVVGDGHLSDPGVGRVASWAGSPSLKRSCSSLETREVLTKIGGRSARPGHCSLHEATEFRELVPESPNSIVSQRSADRVMLKKHSSRQILPSRSRRLWWKLFLWSHRNLHRRRVSSNSQPFRVPEANQDSGYASDIVEHNQATAKSSPGDSSTHNFTDFAGKDSSLWPHNQWLAFPVVESSSFDRVDKWVRDLDAENALPLEEDDEIARGFSFSATPETERAVTPTSGQTAHNISEAIMHANSVVATLHKSSSVAHISSIGLKAIPTICHFNSLKSVDLSNNSIVQITPGSLPKGLHTLDLSKNKIGVIEGLRDLTRLRVLDLSYNRISRIGQGLSRCVVIKELYMAGNKISEVDGLHRLLKLTVLDLSFNKITSTKAIGQLVANYNSLLALNLLGNPIHTNLGEDHLRKALLGLLPSLVYLNKQSVKPFRAVDSVARAALGGGGGNGGSNSLHRYRRATAGKRGNSSGGGGSANKHKGGSSGGSKNRARHHVRKTHSTALVS